MEDKSQVCRTNSGFVYSKCLIYAGFRKQVSRKMFNNKLVVGDVGIESPNEIIAITESVGNSWVALASVGVGIAYPVHPVPSPAFSKVRAVEEFVDESLRCFAHILSRCFLERLLLFDCRRKPRDGEGKSS